MAENQETSAPELIELASEITIAWLQNPNVTPGAQDVPAFLKDMHAALSGLGIAPAQAQAVTHEPKVPVRSSVKPDHLVSLIDGKKYKTLKRHLALNGLTPDDYRARYGLKADYPMVASSYAAQRRDIAQKLGLGRKRIAPGGPDAVAPVEAVAGTSEPVKLVVKEKRATRKSAEVASSVAQSPSDTNAQVSAPAKPKRAAAKSKAATAADTSAAVTRTPKEAAGKPKRAAAKASPAPKPAKPKAAKPKGDAKVEPAPAHSTEA